MVGQPGASGLPVELPLTVGRGFPHERGGDTSVSSLGLTLGTVMVPVQGVGKVWAAFTDAWHRLCTVILTETGAR